MQNCEFSISIYFVRKAPKKFSMQFLWFHQYYLHCDKFSSNSIDLMKCLQRWAWVRCSAWPPFCPDSCSPCGGVKKLPLEEMVDTFVHVKYACLHLEKSSSSFLSTDWKIVVNPIPFVWCFSHSQMEHYFFSYLLTWEVDLIEILEIMA